MTPVAPRPPRRGSGTTLLLTAGEQLLFNRLGVRIRYVFSLIGLTALAGARLFGVYRDSIPYASLVLLLGFILAYNTLGALVLRRVSGHEPGDGAALQRLQRLLTLLDQVALVSLLGLLGGLELFMLPLLVVASFMVSINTSKRESYWFGATLLGMVAALFLLRYIGWIGWHPVLPERWIGRGSAPLDYLGRHAAASFIAWAALASMVFGIVYFSNFVKDKLGRVVETILEGRAEITSLRKLSEDILDIFPFGVLTLDRETRVVSFNPAAVRILGAHPGWTGRRAEEIADLVDSGLHLYLQRAREGEGLTLHNFPFLRPATGQKLFLSITTLAGGPGDRLLVCLEDVTERLRREEEQRELQQILMQTEKMASLGQLAAGVAHDLNNPLTAIDANAQMLDLQLKRGETIGPESELRIRRIMENTERIRLLVKNLLSYARPAPETASPLSLPALIQESVVFCEHQIRKANLVFETRFADGLPRVEGNKTQLQQVFVNLFTNAIQAVAPDTGRIRIDAEADEGGVLIRVGDNGAGIPNENLERIFEPFFTSRPHGGGTGLGLSIVQTIVEKHGGRILVESQVGAGTVFSILLPLQRTPTGSVA